MPDSRAHSSAQQIRATYSPVTSTIIPPGVEIDRNEENDSGWDASDGYRAFFDDSPSRASAPLTTTTVSFTHLDYKFHDPGCFTNPELQTSYLSRNANAGFESTLIDTAHERHL